MSSQRITTRGCVLALVLQLVAYSLAIAQPAAAPTRQPLTVFAAASLTEVMKEIGDAWAANGEPAPKLSFAASSALAKQVEAGAPADVFFSADQEWMAYLAGKNLIRKETRKDLLANRLVLIAPSTSDVKLKIAKGFPLAAALGTGRLATGDPESVPAGRYARSALTTLGVWDAVGPKVAGAENVRVALAYVARGEAPLGIVYATDARVEPRVKVVDTFPEDSHTPITYPVAALRDSKPEAAKFVEFLAGAKARAAFERAGFTVLGSTGR